MRLGRRWAVGMIITEAGLGRVHRVPVRGDWDLFRDSCKIKSRREDNNALGSYCIVLYMPDSIDARICLLMAAMWFDGAVVAREGNSCLSMVS
jgi:hypothetical protein